jgi:hypothetical protein
MKIRKTHLKHETMKHLLVRGGRTRSVYLFRKLLNVVSHEFFCPYHTIWCRGHVLGIRRYPVWMLEGILAVFRLSCFIGVLVSTAIVARLFTGTSKCFTAFQSPSHNLRRPLSAAQCVRCSINSNVNRTHAFHINAPVRTFIKAWPHFSIFVLYMRLVHYTTCTSEDAPFD